MSCNPSEITRREAQREERRAAILAVAQQAFHDHGFGGTTMSGIAAKLGGSKGTLWAYFSSKEDLFAATIDGLVAEFAPFFELDPAKSLADALESYCTDFIAMMVSVPVIALNRLVIAESPRFPALGRIFYEKAPARRQRVLAQHFEQRIARGEMQPVDPLFAAAQLHHLCQAGLFMQILLGLAGAPTRAQIRADAAKAARLFVDGCGTGARADVAR